MPASTPFLGLYKPGGGSTGLILPDEVVDIDRINGNSDIIDQFAKSYGPATERNHQFYGPAASLGGIIGMKLGDTYQESDGNKVLWKYDGTNWVTNEGGMYLIRPSSVVGGTINADGSVTPTAQAVSFNDVFSARYRDYLVRFAYQTASASGNWVRFRRAGTDLSSSDYGYTQIYANGGPNPGSGVGTSTQVPVAAYSGVFHQGELKFSLPGHTALAKFLMVDVNTAGSTSASFTRASNGVAAAQAPFDGFTFSLSTAVAYAAGTPNYFRVYGLP